MKINYRSNNSGANWRLNDDIWEALEAAGWTVNWEKDEDGEVLRFLCHTDTNGDVRFLGPRAKEASKEFKTPGDAMREFENVTNQSVSDEGCTCCGDPHSFSWGKGKKRKFASGEECLEYLYEGVKPMSLREAYEKASKENR